MPPVTVTGFFITQIKTAMADIFSSLLCIQEKHNDFFLDRKKTIIDYIKIDWNNQITIAIINDDMPKELLADIREMLLVLNP